MLSSPSYRCKSWDTGRFNSSPTFTWLISDRLGSGMPARVTAALCYTVSLLSTAGFLVNFTLRKYKMLVCWFSSLHHTITLKTPSFFSNEILDWTVTHNNRWKLGFSVEAWSGMLSKCPIYRWRKIWIQKIMTTIATVFWALLVCQTQGWLFYLTYSGTTSLI